MPHHAHTKRAVAFAQWLHSTVLWTAAHRQIVLTIPKMLRAYFRYDRRLLGDLCRVAAGVIVESFRVLLGQPAAEPGLLMKKGLLSEERVRPAAVVGELGIQRPRNGAQRRQ